MHFEVIVEDSSGAIAVGVLLEKLLGANHATHSWRIHPCKGIGRIPSNLEKAADPRKRLLLDRLPGQLAALGKALGPESAVLVVVDSDRRDCVAFKNELLRVLKRCDPAPKTLFRIATEEIEAWYLGDRAALLAAYPRAKKAPLDGYRQDSVCGTWEVLADAVFPGGAKALKALGWPRPGQEKANWAQTIAPKMDVESNQSQSFRAFRDGVRKLAAA